MKRSSCLLGALAAAGMVQAAPIVQPEPLGVLGRLELASPARIVTLVPLTGNRLLAVDAAGVGQLWDVSRAQRLGVTTAGTPALADATRLLAPKNSGAGCILGTPAAALADGRLVTVEGQAVRFCDLSGHVPAVDIPAPGLADPGTAVAVTPDGSAVYQGTLDGDVLVVHPGGTPPNRVHAHESAVVALGTLGEGGFASVGEDGTVRAFGADGRRLRALDAVRLHRTRNACDVETVRAAAFAKGGTRLLLATIRGEAGCPDESLGARVRLLELPSGKVRWELPATQVTAAAFSENGEELAVAVALHPEDRVDPLPTQVVRLKAASGTPAEAAVGHHAQITALRVSPDGSHVASGDAGGTWKLWDLGSGAERVTVSSGAGAVLDLRFTPDGSGILSQQEDDSVRLWQASDGRQTRLLIAPPAPDPTRLSPACRLERDRAAALTRTGPARRASLVSDPDAHAGLVAAQELALSADGETVLAPAAEESCASLSSNGCPASCQRTYRLERVALRSGRRVQTFDVDEELLAGCTSPSGAFVTQSEHGGLHLWDAQGVPRGVVGRRLGKATSCEATPDGRRLLVGTPRTVSLWDGEQPTEGRLAVPRRSRMPGPVALRPSGDLGAEVDGREVRLRAWPSGALVGRLPLQGQDDAPTAVTFSPDGQRLLVGTARGAILAFALAPEGAAAQRNSAPR